MAESVQTELSRSLDEEREPIINDFQIVVATVNGTGSQTANSAILRALFRMGIPVNGKNIFPSNIQGLPTWFTIRLNKDGYTARREVSEVLVAMNQATVTEDVQNLPAGGVCFYPEEWHIREDREDVVYYPFPVKAIISQTETPPNLRDYIANMAYVGVVAAMLSIDLAEIRAALDIHFTGKQKAVDQNMAAVNLAYEWAQDHLPKRDPFTVRRMDKTSGKIMLDGNSAGALGAVFGGVTFCAWYPITPSTSLVDALRDYLLEFRHDPATQKPTYAVVQAEDELAAIGMVVGAGWAGARSMTSTSGPGLALMSEFSGLSYLAEIPAVIWDIQRVGPSTGLPTRTCQGDVMKAYFLGTGDTKHVCLLPGSIAECFEFGWRAFDLAERLQTLVFVLSDLDLGMNLWMSDPFEYPTEPMDRGKVLTAEDLERVEFARYRDVDGDGIPYRTLPGTNHPEAAYFTRGSGHDDAARYSERPEDWEGNMQRLGRKFDTARTLVPKPIVNTVKGAKIGIIAYGTSDPAVIEARDSLKADGIKTSYLRLRALPFEDTTAGFIEKCDRVYVVENNTDAQVLGLLRMEYPQFANRLRSLAMSNGLPLSARWVAASLKQQEEK